MHCDIKKFQYSGNQALSISSVDINASVYGTTMDLTVPLDKKVSIIKSFSDAKIDFKSTKLTTISVYTPLHRTENIKKALDILAKDGLMNQAFAQEITKNYPNGHGGTMDLNNPLKGINGLLMLAAAGIFNLNAQLAQKEQNRKQENLDNLHQETPDSLSSSDSETDDDMPELLDAIPLSEAPPILASQSDQFEQSIKADSKIPKPLIRFETQKGRILDLEIQRFDCEIKGCAYTYHALLKYSKPHISYEDFTRIYSEAKIHAARKHAQFLKANAPSSSSYSFYSFYNKGHQDPNLIFLEQIQNELQELDAEIECHV